MADAELTGLGDFFDATQDWREDVTVRDPTRTIGTPLEHGPYVEYGTRPHVITGDPLSFIDDGQRVFTQRVMHPGTDAQPHVRPGLRAVEPELGRLAVQSDSLDEFLDKAALLALRNIKRLTPVRTGALRASYSIF